MSGPGRSAAPFDVGLQPERTALAWRRTALALTVGSLAAVRILPTLLGAWALVPAGTALVVAIVILVASHRRYRMQHRLLTTSSHARIALPDGTLAALVAGTIVLGGLLCLAVVLEHH